MGGWLSSFGFLFTIGLDLVLNFTVFVIRFIRNRDNYILLLFLYYTEFITVPNFSLITFEVVERRKDRVDPKIRVSNLI